MKITVNETEHQFDGDPEMPVLWYLRDELKLTGTKYGCGKAQCGACTVHMDGQPIFACLTPMAALDGKTVTTIEGLHPEQQHPVQVAWKSHNVPQCGYCQSGQMMRAAALLADNPAPSDEDISSGMAPNICRCGTYPRIRAAIKSAARKNT